MVSAPTVYGITAESLRQDLGVEVPEIYVVVAKHSVMGLDGTAMQEILGCTQEELAEVEADPTYKAVRIHIAGVYASQSVSQSAGWDAIEQTAIKNLMERLPHERDAEFLLKVAAVANRATRTHGQGPQVLNPMQQGRSTITLSQRLVSKIKSNGDREESEERKLSIHNGSMGNPTFSEVDDLLSVKAIPKVVGISTHAHTPSPEELIAEFDKRSQGD